NYNTLYGIAGDAKAVLQGINKALADKDIIPDAAYVDEVKETRQALRDDLKNSIEPYGDIAAIISEQLPESTILATAVTIPGYTWANKLIDIHEPGHYHHMPGEGIGQGLPMASGGKIAHPEEPVLLVAWDGG